MHGGRFTPESIGTPTRGRQPACRALPAERPSIMHRSFRLLACLVPGLLGCAEPTGPFPLALPAPTELAVGAAHACRILGAGTLYCWGRGSEGQLGRGEFEAVPALPGQVFDAASFSTVVAGRSHTCALDTEGLAWCWGSNELGQLGIDAEAQVACGAAVCSPVPAPVVGNRRFVSLAAGDQFTCGLEAEGSAWCWGLGDVGQLGQPISGDCAGNRCSFVPVRVQGEQRLRMLSAGRAHVCGLTEDGEAVCWGYNDQGQLGRSDRVDSPIPRPVASDTRFVQVSAGGLHTCAVTSDAAAWCWGIDAIGAGPTILESSVPVPVIGGAGYSHVESGRVSTCGVRADGLLDCWGTNLSSEMGFPEQEIHHLFPAPRRVDTQRRFETLAGEYQTYCGLDAAGAVWCWGAGTQGQLGSGSVDSAEPLIVPLPAVTR
jgi:alpha-tubulin suppressor-like RCC1 family protein